MTDQLPLDLPRGLFVDGRWSAGRGNRRYPVIDPATEQVLEEVADAGPDDALDALESAAAAQRAWSRTAPRERGEMLRRAFEGMRAQEDELARLMTLEMGKPLEESRGEVRYAAEFLRWFSEEAVRVGGDYSTAPDGGSRTLVLHQPVGPCLLITPWNFPLAMITRKVGPALAAGCTVVLKPAAQTPLSALAMVQILAAAGVPGGVVNLVTTTDPAALVGPLLADPRLRKLSFTGSTAVGKRLAAQAADQMLRVSLELGGNAPFIVFDDADVDVAVEAAMIAKLRNMGEACTAANRFLVASPVAERFSSALAERFSALRLGHGLDDGVQIGPLIDADARQKVVALVDDAISGGAQVLSGGSAPDGRGFFYQPTVLRGAPADAAIAQEEIFGPVASITEFASEEEAVAIANDTPYGLSAYCFTRDLSRALRVADELEVGMVGVNRGMVSNAAAPFGGVKWSGLGREGGVHGIQEYLEVKYLSVAR